MALPVVGRGKPLRTRCWWKYLSTGHAGRLLNSARNADHGVVLESIRRINNQVTRPSVKCAAVTVTLFAANLPDSRRAIGRQEGLEHARSNCWISLAASAFFL